MKINPRLWDAALDVTPFEVQEFDGRKVELFKMSQLDGVREEFVDQKGQFAAWSSVDGVNYKLFIEDGYYDEIKDLYRKDINQIWINYWDICDSIYKRFSRCCIYPLMIVAVILCILSLALGSVLGKGGSYAIIILLIVMFVGMLILNRAVKKKQNDEHTKSRKQIYSILGEKRFEDLVKKQKEYMDKYFDELYKTDEENTEATEEIPALDEKNEVVEEKAEEAVEATEEKAEEATEATEEKSEDVVEAAEEKAEEATEAKTEE